MQESEGYETNSYRTKNSEEIFCCICGTSSFSNILNLDGREVIKCRSCSLVKSHPMPADAEIEALYEEDYFKTNYFSLDDEELKTNHYRQISAAADFLNNVYSENPPRVLEIGPGRGHFLKATLKLGFQVEAIELAKDIANELQTRFRCPVHTGTLEKLDLPAGVYDAVVAFDVIEHLKHPNLWLKHIHRILAPQGHLILSTVSIDNFLDKMGRLLNSLRYTHPVKRLYPEFHLHYFTPSTLSLLLWKSGFEILSIDSENYDCRKATSSRLEQIVLRSIYGVHNLTRKKTNQYLVARKI